MVAAYQTAIAEAAAAPPPGDAVQATFPAHFRTDGTERTVRLLREMGLPESRIARLWDVA